MVHRQFYQVTAGLQTLMPVLQMEVCNTIYDDSVTGIILTILSRCWDLLWDWRKQWMAVPASLGGHYGNGWIP